MLNRAAGLISVLAGLALLWFIIPAQVEAFDEGWVNPDTLPTFVSYILILAGAVQTVLPGGETAFDLRQSLRTALLLLIVTAAVWLMSRFGFVYVAPGLALVVMLFIGERRPVWLLSGIIAAPALIWLIVEQLLERPLP
jgi:putative tricarboxylic transport membrane protein